MSVTGGRQSLNGAFSWLRQQPQLEDQHNPKGFAAGCCILIVPLET